MKLREHWKDAAGFLVMVQEGQKSVVPFMIAGGLGEAAIPFVSLYFSAQIVTLVTQSRFADCYRPILLLLILTLVFSLLSRICRQSFDAVKENAFDSIQKQLSAKVYRMEYEKLERTETSDKIRSLRANEMTTGGIVKALDLLYKTTTDLWSFLFSVAFLCRMAVQTGSQTGGTAIYAAVFLVTVLLIFYWETKIMGRTQNQANAMIQEAAHDNAVFNYLSDTATSPEAGKDIRIFGMQNLLISFMRQRLSNNIVMKELYRIQGRTDAKTTFLSQLIAGGAYLLVGLQAVRGVISVGDVLLYSGAIIRLTGTVQDMIETVGYLLYHLDYLKTYREFINSPSLSYDGTLPVEKRNDGQYEFEFQDVCFSYPNRPEPILNHLNLKFTVGKSFAIVGRNGAGKTTLVKLLCRLYEPTSGKILLNGIDIRYYDYREYVQIFSVVFQDFKIFALPLDQNVAGSEQADERRVWECLENAGLKERVEAMPDGIRTNLFQETGGGVELSGGEAQKLAIARALYRNAPFVILDEPTAALDPFSEAEIYENFGELTRNKTAVYISHRMSSCKFCDEIIVMDHGKIAERGNHKNLMEKDGLYAELYRTQAKYYEDGRIKDA